VGCAGRNNSEPSSDFLFVYYESIAGPVVTPEARGLVDAKETLLKKPKDLSA
jgi:hypothetical protein